ncbi:hypothetical protein [Teredinibacter purpureus]|uniref:hypothetical protein n=1 Tax=Teredinibacter purpureus TaxID=2731756 RepID=UPI0006974B3E|nr:hypothetical protein [Teredinibacter purpureus]
MANSLLFSLATGGFQWRYRTCLQSHKAFAQKNGYLYSVVDRPKVSTLDLDVVWLKIFLLREALKKDYEWVVFLDADTEVTPRCPPFEQLNSFNKSIYMANGYSERVNSGVIILRNDAHSRAYIETIIKNCQEALPEEDDVGWGENGHVIHYAKSNPHVHLLDHRWNNNRDETLTDFIRHYSAGPLRHLYKPALTDFILYKTTKTLQSVLTRAARCLPGPQKSLTQKMIALTVATQNKFPEF